MPIMSPDWIPDTDSLPVDEHEITIARVHWPSLFDKTIDRLFAELSDSEQKRAGEYRLSADRKRFIVGRGVARDVLSEVTERPNIEFEEGICGKPKLALDNPESSNFEFNISHAGDWVLTGFSRDIPLGVDVEDLERFDGGELGVAQNVLTENELETLQQMPEEERARFFIHLWTYKEAVQKATGEGLYRPPESLELDIRNEEVVGVRHLGESNNELGPFSADDYQLISFSVGDEALGAIVWEANRKDSIKLRRFDLTHWLQRP